MAGPLALFDHAQQPDGEIEPPHRIPRRGAAPRPAGLDALATSRGHRPRRSHNESDFASSTLDLVGTVSTADFGTGKDYEFDVSEQLQDAIDADAELGFLFTYVSVGGDAAPMHFSDFELAVA